MFWINLLKPVVVYNAQMITAQNKLALPCAAVFAIADKNPPSSADDGWSRIPRGTGRGALDGGAGGHIAPTPADCGRTADAAQNELELLQKEKRRINRDCFLQRITYVIVLGAIVLLDFITRK